MLTGADGRFHFADVPEGRIFFSVQKPGFSDPANLVGGPIWGWLWAPARTIFTSPCSPTRKL